METDPRLSNLRPQPLAHLRDQSLRRILARSGATTTLFGGGTHCGHSSSSCNLAAVSPCGTPRSGHADILTTGAAGAFEAMALTATGKRTALLSVGVGVNSPTGVVEHEKGYGDEPIVPRVLPICGDGRTTAGTTYQGTQTDGQLQLTPPPSARSLRSSASSPLLASMTSGGSPWCSPAGAPPEAMPAPPPALLALDCSPLNGRANGTHAGGGGGGEDDDCVRACHMSSVAPPTARRVGFAVRHDPEGAHDKGNAGRSLGHGCLGATSSADGDTAAWAADAARAPPQPSSRVALGAARRSSSFWEPPP